MASQMAYLKINIIHRQLGVGQEIRSLFFAPPLSSTGSAIFRRSHQFIAIELKMESVFVSLPPDPIRCPQLRLDDAISHLRKAVRAVSQGSEARRLCPPDATPLFLIWEPRINSAVSQGSYLLHHQS